MKNGSNKGIQRLLNATRFTIMGIRSAWSNEEAFRQEALVLILVIPAGLLKPLFKKDCLFVPGSLFL